MELQTFKRVLIAFADQPTDIVFSPGRLIVEIRDELIEASLEQRDGELWISEPDSEPVRSFTWLTKRIAKLPLLADRILNFIDDEENFVTPTGHLLDDFENTLVDSSIKVDDAFGALSSAFSRKMAAVTKVLYLTSDAGEGKSTIINRLAREQATLYKQNKTDWLLVPIRLGGRPFMRLDDVVVAELTNRLRFMLYFDAFVELVRLNVIVPALDGFEEVFIESAPGEGVSALGNLVSDLHGDGRILVAARKAYFEIQSFSTQARFFDSLKNDSGVEFSRLSIDRWSNKQFCEYVELRGLENAEKLYSTVSSRLTPDHPLLTRAVLVHRLIDVAEDSDIDEVLNMLGSEPEDYFYGFVDAIVEREAHEKWIDKGGDAAEPLISVQEHHILLAMIAREMWINSVDSLKGDYADLISDIFSSEQSKTPKVARQVRERLHHHSLLVSTGQNQKMLVFDHEDFQWFFLGEALAKDLVDSANNDLVGMLRVGGIPPRTAEAALTVLNRLGSNIESVRDRLLKIGKIASETSYTKENVGLLISKIFGDSCMKNTVIENLMFPEESLRSVSLEDVEFKSCHFKPTSLTGSDLKRISFNNCQFERIELNSETMVKDCCVDDSEISSLVIVDDEQSIFDPMSIRIHLQKIGFTCAEGESVVSSDVDIQNTKDRETELATHALRAFMRSTHINENLMRLKLGTRGSEFIDNVLPKLLQKNIVTEVQYKGSGEQRRFKLNIPMRNIDNAIRKAKTLDEFVEELEGEDT